jgi:hypothetical protein
MAYVDWPVKRCRPLAGAAGLGGAAGARCGLAPLRISCLLAQQSQRSPRFFFGSTSPSSEKKIPGPRYRATSRPPNIIQRGGHGLLLPSATLPQDQHDTVRFYARSVVRKDCNNGGFGQRDLGDHQHPVLCLQDSVRLARLLPAMIALSLTYLPPLQHRQEADVLQK